MTNWDESKHPRDEEGKFTYKNGGSDGVIRGGVEETVEADPRDISNTIIHPIIIMSKQKKYCSIY